MPREERDSQRSRVYKADDSLKPFAEPLPSVKDVERFVKHVWQSKRLHNEWTKCRPDWLPYVKDGRRCRRALGGAGGITIPRWARSSDIVLHELSHTITQRHFGRIVAGHGWQYCSIYLKLALWFMSREAHDALKASFKTHKVRFTEPRKRPPLSVEQKAVLVERVAMARAARKR